MLFLTPILDVAVGLILIFSLVALMITQLNALIGTLLKWRSRQLRDGIRQLISDPQLQLEFLKHPLIKLLLPEELEKMTAQAQSQGVSVEQMLGKSDPQRVTNIPNMQFVDALLSVLRDRAVQQNQELHTLKTLIEEMPVGALKSDLRVALSRFIESPGLASLQTLRQKIESAPEHTALFEAYDRLEKVLPLTRTQSDGVIGVLQGIETLANDDLKKVLQTALISAKSLDDAKNKLAAWFDDGMQRTSVAFKAQMQWVTLLISTILVIVLNIDTLHIARALWQTPELRQGVAFVAQTYAASGVLEQNLANAQATLDSVGEADAADATNTETPPEEAAQDVLLDEMLSNLQAAGTTLQQIGELQLPIGWENIPIDEKLIATYEALGMPDPRTNARNLWNLTPANPDWFGNLLRKAIGWVTAILAASLGAPFWFDLLKRITRSTPASSAG